MAVAIQEEWVTPRGRILRGPKDRKNPVRLSRAHYTALQLISQGHTYQSAAIFVGLCTGRIASVARSPLGRAYLAKLQAQADLEAARIVATIDAVRMLDAAGIDCAGLFGVAAPRAAAGRRSSTTPKRARVQSQAPTQAWDKTHKIPKRPRARR